jgi:hypothetical protein
VQSVAASNIDGDEDLDVLYATGGTGQVTWIENTEAGSFEAPEAIIGEVSSPRAVALSDVTGDGRLDAVNGGGAVLSLHPSGPAAPLTSTEKPSGVKRTKFVARGRVDPRGDSTQVRVQYGRDRSFGEDSTVTVPDSPLGGVGATDVRAEVTGLRPSTTYYYRLQAANKKGGNVGRAASITTANRPPVVADDQASTKEDSSTTIAVLANDEDIGGALDASSLSVTDAPSNGSTSVRGGEGTVTYRHDGSDNLSDEFGYTVADGNGAVSDTATVTVDVLEVTLAFENGLRALGSQRVGLRGDTVGVTVRNTGDVSLPSLSASLAEGADFSVVGGPEGAEVEPGGTISAQVAFRPASPGLRTDTLVITSGRNASARVPLTGRGATVDVDASPPSLQEQGPVSVKATLGGGFAPSEDQTLLARKGGDQTFRQFALQKTSDSTYEASVPRDLVTERGIDYYIRLSDDRSVVTVPGATPGAAKRRPRHLPVQFDQLEAEGTFEANTYRMVSIPARPERGGSLREALETSYGAYDAKEWRLLRWQPDAEEYRGYPELDTLMPGQGIWVATQEGDRFALTDGQTVDASEPRRMPIAPGWNQVGSPFGFAVPWDSVRAATKAASASAIDLGEPVAYRDSAYAYNRSALRPWRGYFVYNATSTPDTLVVPPVGTSSSSSTKNRAVATSGGGAVPAQAAADSGRYTMQVHARVPESGMADRQTYLGFRSEAHPGYDDQDFAAAPPIGSHIHTRIVGRTGEGEGRHYAGSFKPAEGDGQVWVLSVSGEFGETFDVERTVTLRFDASGTLPESFGRYVLDLEKRQMVPLEKGRFAFSLSGTEQRRFKVILGTKAFAKSKSEGIALQAFEDRLLGNAPNPFRNETTIQYQLSEQRTVTIEVFNVLGQRVQRLVEAEPKEAGRHTVTWQGRSQYGKPVGSGVYFYRIEAGDFRASRKMVLVR